MELKVLTLNIWRYFEWDKRKEKVIKFLKEQDADIVFLQETAYDERLKNKWENQVHELNCELNYKDFCFFKMAKMKKWHKESIDWVMYYGLGILSKYPIKCKEVVFLPLVERDRKFAFIHAILETPKGNLDIINVHLENTDKGSKQHLKYVLKWCKKKKIKPIIAGDFNMQITSNIIGLADKEYFISYKLKPYVSFMPTEFSNNKEPVTLDYIIASKDRFKIKHVECIDASPSDHKPIIALIEIKNK